MLLMMQKGDSFPVEIRRAPVKIVRYPSILANVFRFYWSAAQRAIGARQLL